MSDASEVKRWKADKPFFMWTYDEAMSCVEKRPDEIEVILASDHDRIVAELKAEVELLRYELSQLDGERKSAWEIVDLHEATIARQARVIEELMEQRSELIMDEIADKYELEAIEQEQGEGT